jgi:hypothetical protein
MRPAISLTVAVLLPALGGAGCEGLDLSAKGEGTGIQVIGAVVVVAKYRASQRQKAIAEEQARRAFVDLALEPAYEARAKKLKRQVGSGRAPAGPSAGTTGTTAPDPQAAARAELAALMASWKETASNYTHGRYAGDFAAPGADAPDQAAVTFPRLSESQVLAASASYVPRYLAVSVPAEQAVAGARASVMLWDTRMHRLASDTVYALDRTPSATKPTEIDSLKVLYAGQ